MATTPERKKEDVMRRTEFGVAMILILAGLLVGCSQRVDTPAAVKPAKVEQVPGTNLKKVSLSPKAAERLGIKTTPVRDEQVEARKRLVGGEVVKSPAAGVLVRVPLSPQDLNAVAVGQPASVRPLAGAADAKSGMTARPVKADGKESLLYAVEGATKLAPGERVRVEVSLSGAGMRKVVPHGAVVYDAQGKTWVYANPEPLVFVRQPINIDYIEGDRAVLSDGPAPGTAVVIVGAAELFGAEHGGK
jgi:hypothetical protein